MPPYIFRRRGAAGEEEEPEPERWGIIMQFELMLLSAESSRETAILLLPSFLFLSFSCSFLVFFFISPPHLLCTVLLLLPLLYYTCLYVTQLYRPIYNKGRQFNRLAEWVLLLLDHTLAGGGCCWKWQAEKTPVPPKRISSIHPFFLF